MQLGFLLELPGMVGAGKFADGIFSLHALVESLRAYIVLLVLVNLLMRRRPGGSSGIHGPFLLFGHAGCFVRGDVCFAKTQVLGFFCGLVGLQLELLLFGLRLLYLGLFRRGAYDGALLILLKFQLRLLFTHAFPPPLPRKVWWS